jgi:hemerythrin superfamily protein
MKWGMIGSAIAGGVALIPLIPAVKKRAMRVTTILKKDHRMISGMIAAMQLTPKFNGMVRNSLFEQIRRSVMVHAQVEEEVFYPAMRNFAFPSGTSKVDEAYRQHQIIKDLLNDLATMDPMSNAFDTRFAEFKKNIEQHVKEEENEMFAMVAERMSSDKQEELGRRIHDRKMDLKTRMAA